MEIFLANLSFNVKRTIEFMQVENITFTWVNREESHLFTTSIGQIVGDFSKSIKIRALSLTTK